MVGCDGVFSYVSPTTETGNAVHCSGGAEKISGWVSVPVRSFVWRYVAWRERCGRVQMGRRAPYLAYQLSLTS